MEVSDIKYKISFDFNFVHYCYCYRGYNIRVFLSGDYEFLCALYGHSGASGMQAEFLKMRNVNNIHLL